MLGDTEIARILRESYRPGGTFGSGFGRLFAQWFAEWGVVLLDAADPELNRIAQPIYHAAVERAAELSEKLLARGRELDASGYHQQVKVTPASTLLFVVQNGIEDSWFNRNCELASGVNFVSQKTRFVPLQGRVVASGRYGAAEF